jgi:hypothetical protein
MRVMCSMHLTLAYFTTALAERVQIEFHPFFRYLILSSAKLYWMYGIRTRDLSNQAAADLRLRSRDHRDNSFIMFIITFALHLVLEL